jgi:hypothetical protein
MPTTVRFLKSRTMDAGQAAEDDDAAQLTQKRMGGLEQ